MSSPSLTTTQRSLENSQQESYHRLLELEVLYRTAPVALGFLDHELRYVRLNEALAAINHRPVEDHIGEYASELNVGMAQIIVPMMQQVLDSKRPVLGFEIEGTTSPGDAIRERVWLVNIHPVTNAKTFGVSIVFHDITALKESKEIRNRFSSIVESSDDAMISMTLTGAITSWNRAAQRMFAYSAEEVMGKTISILAAPHDSSKLPEILERLQQGGSADHYETVYRRKDGQLIDVSLTVSPISDRHGCVIGASQTARNITEQKRSDAALLRSNEELRQFAFAAAHDLQEPLRNISLCAQMLDTSQKSKISAKGHKYLECVIDSARRMQALIKDLLEYTEIASFHHEPGQAIDCNEVCQTALDNLSSALKTCEANLSVDSLPTVFVAERTHLIQLFQNLIGNALKYRSTERKTRIHVSANLRNNRWVFSVEDNGIGIAPEYHEQIFGVFKRLHGQDVPGTGIGLAICKRIVDHHGGHLWLESEVGRGSTFYFSFPESEIPQ